MPEELNPYSAADTEANAGRTSSPVRQLLPAAIGILVPAILHIFGGLFFFVYVFQASQADEQVFADMMPIALYYGISMLYCLLLATGAFTMLRRGSYVWAMTVSVLALVPFLGPCYLLAVPFGVWGIIVLRRPEVRESFRQF